MGFHDIVATVSAVLLFIAAAAAIIRNVQAITTAGRSLWLVAAGTITRLRHADPNSAPSPPTPPTGPTAQFEIGITIGGDGPGGPLTDAELESFRACVETNQGTSGVKCMSSNQQGAWYILPGSGDAPSRWQARLYPGPGVIVETCAQVVHRGEREAALQLPPSSRWWLDTLESVRALMSDLGARHMVVGLWASAYASDGLRLVDLDTAPCPSPVAGREPDQVSPWYYRSELLRVHEASAPVVAAALDSLLLHFSYRQRDQAVSCLIDQAGPDNTA